MGISSSSLLDESKSNYIKGRADAELESFSPFYRRQYLVAFFSKLQDEVEQHKPRQTQLLKQREPPKPAEVLYEENVLYFDDTRKWKERFVVVRANYSLECHDSYETFMKGVPPRHKLLPTGGTVLTSEEKYMVMVDACFPDLNSVKEEFAPPMVGMPGQFPVYLRLPYRRDSYFCFRVEDRWTRFIAILTDCIRHQNQDFLKKTACEVQTFLKAIQFYREEKGCYESWDMLIGSDVRVLANQVMEELLPALQTEMMPRLKGRKADRKRAWFATMEAAYILVQEQLLKGLTALKEECREMAKQQEPRIRSNMDQIVSSRDFLEGKLKATVTGRAESFCFEHVQPHLASVLEDLMGPISSGFQEVRLLCERLMDQLCQGFQENCNGEELRKSLEGMRKASLQGCYQHVDVLCEQLQDLNSRYNFSNCSGLVHSTQLDMQQLMENAVYTFELLLQIALKDNPAKPGSAMEKAKLRVLKQYDYDSSTVRKRIFHNALLQITLPALKKNLAPQCKPELQTFDEYIFADYTNFIHMENVYEDVLLQTLESEVNKVVKEAASLKKHNLFVDGADMRLFSQSSLYAGTPSGSTPTSPASAAWSQSQTPASSPLRNGQLESPVQKETTTTTEGDTVEKADKLITAETEEGDASNTADAEKENTPKTAEAGIIPSTAETETESSPHTAEAEESLPGTAIAENNMPSEAEDEKISTAEAEENLPSAAEAEENMQRSAEEAQKEAIPSVAETEKEDTPIASEPMKDDMLSVAEEKEDMPSIAEAESKSMPSVSEAGKEDMLGITDAEKEDMTIAAEPKKEEMPIVAEVQTEDMPTTAEPTEEPTPSVAEVETVDMLSTAEPTEEPNSAAKVEKEDEDMNIPAEPSTEDTLVVAEAEKEVTPSSAEPSQEDTSSVSEAVEEDTRHESEVQREDTPIAAEPSKEDTSSVAEAEKEDEPGATEPSTENMPHGSEAEKEDMPIETEPSKEDASSVAEAEKEDTSIAAEPSKEDTSSVGEAEKEDDPRAANTENVETALQSDAPSPCPNTDSAGEQNLCADTMVSLSLDAPLAETKADTGLVTDKTAEVKDTEAKAVLTQSPEQAVTDTEEPTSGDSNTGMISEDSTQSEEDGRVISPCVKVAEELEEGGTTSSGTYSTEEATESDVSQTSDPTEEGTEGSAVTVSTEPILEGKETEVCFEAGTTAEGEVVERKVTGVTLNAEPATELTESTLHTAEVSPSVRPTEEPAEVKPQALDCIREIRDLVVEIIEVEELVQHYPESGSA
ncbi:protein Niban 1a [Megalops cyprinoides]|uniref:protein Niban 1a n=1 Tax=Megalops cyprinoides TaxID=118141 RepID=UPI0018653386|nr:protein Niban 1a [Megalops cyprinoides]